ncbi:MAG: hypothetical protein KC586_22610 [Myxococcales bacterium]|nr:hypothetical protein [Myxococcales bacterium]
MTWLNGSGRARRRTSWLALLAAVCLTWAAWAPPARATVMVEVSLEDMIRDSVAIVRGRVIHSGTQMLMREHGLDPATVTTLQVGEWLKGQGGPTITLRELGGLIGPGGQGGGMRIDGTPTYGLGEEVVLFLERRPEAPYDLRTLGMVQGKFLVRHGLGDVPTTVRRDLSGIAFARWAEGRQTVSHPNEQPTMRLDAFLDYVRQARVDLAGGER